MMGWKKRGWGITFGGVARLVLPEPGKVLVLEPGHVGVVVFVVFLTCPFGHIGGWFSFLDARRSALYGAVGLDG